MHSLFAKTQLIYIYICACVRVFCHRGRQPACAKSAIPAGKSTGATAELPALEGGQKASAVIEQYLQGIMKKSVKMADLRDKISSISPADKLPVHNAILGSRRVYVLIS